MVGAKHVTKKTNGDQKKAKHSKAKNWVPTRQNVVARRWLGSSMKDTCRQIMKLAKGIPIACTTSYMPSRC